MTAIQQISLVTDFGDGLYVGQMRAHLAALLPALPVIDLVHDLPAFRPDLAAYLLPALVRDMPDGMLYLCVVDPGVGGDRALLLVLADGAWLMGPDNGLLACVIQRARSVSVWRIGWRPALMSASFHGRDWFVPVAGRLCLGQDLQLIALASDDVVGARWLKQLSAILYVDRFGNLITGMDVPERNLPLSLQVGWRHLPRVRTFCEVESGVPFWYENAFGLVEIAVNQGRADQLLGLAVGGPVGPFMSHPSARPPDDHSPSQ
jgi:hypothetical protein